MRWLVAVVGASLMGAAVIGVAPIAVGEDGAQLAHASPAAQDRDVELDFLPWCAGPRSMNCIESIAYLLNGQWVTATPLAHDGPDTPQTYAYETPGLEHEGGRTAVNAGLIERGDINGFPAYQFQLQAHPHGIGTLWDPPINRCDKGDPSKPGKDPCWRAPWLAETDYRFTFRTSTLIPIFAQTSIVGMQTSIEALDNGRRVSITGRPGPSQWVLDYKVAERDDRFDAQTYEWGGFLADVRARNGVLAECEGLGIATAYSNGNGGYMPEWDSQTGTLVFGTDGFHYGPDGKVYRGQAEIYVPGQLARCMWKVDPRQVSRMEVEVYTEDGVEAAGTKSVGYDVKSDVVKIIAIDFTYSQKQIVARPTPVKAQPGKKACNSAKTMCVTVDRSRKSARVTMAKIKGASEVTAVALRGTREEKSTQTRGSVSGGKASFTVSLSGRKSKGQVWVLRTPSTFISSFQVG